MNLSTVIDQAITSRFEGTHTCIPGRIESYDPSKRSATVQPSVRLRMDAGISVEIPPIAGVPVIFPACSAFTMDYPLAQGDSVLILFSEASIGKWLESVVSGIVDAEDSTRFSLTDAICLPGLYPFQQLPTPRASIIVDQRGGMTLKVSSGVKATLGEDGLLGLTAPGGSVKDLLQDLWNELNSSVVNLNAWGSAISATGSTPVVGSQFAPIVTATAAQLVSIATKLAKVSAVLK